MKLFFSILILFTIPIFSNDSSEIKRIRRIFSQTEKAVASGKYKNLEDSSERIQRKRYIDKKGQLKKCVIETGSDDSAYSLEFYYQNTKLRFVFIQAGAVNGSRLEHRIYFDLKGKRIRELHKYTKGPGYTFPNPWPDEELNCSL